MSRTNSSAQQLCSNLIWSFTLKQKTSTRYIKWRQIHQMKSNHNTKKKKEIFKNVTRRDFTFSCLKSMELRAHSTMVNRSWSAIRYIKLKLLRLGCFFSSCWRTVVTIFCSCRSSWSQWKNSIISWDVLGPWRTLQYSSELAVLVQLSVFTVEAKRVVGWLNTGWAGRGGDEVMQSFLVVNNEELLATWSSGRVKIPWSVGVTSGSWVSCVNLGAWINALLCCFISRSHLYMGLNMFLPPRTRFARTAVDNGYFGKEFHHGCYWLWPMLYSNMEEDNEENVYIQIFVWLYSWTEKWLKMHQRFNNGFIILKKCNWHA